MTSYFLTTIKSEFGKYKLIFHDRPQLSQDLPEDNQKLRQVF